MGQFETNGAPIAAWVYTTGNKVGDDTLHMTEPATGWKAGMQIVLPGTGASALDDDVATIQSISPDLLTIKLTAPLKHDHSATSDPVYGNRPAFAMNLSPGTVDFSSENPNDISRRGAIMIMNDNMDSLNYTTFTGLGRTDKSKPLTDPAVDANGQAIAATDVNPRGRYALHFHENGGTLDGMQAMVFGCRVIGSPGWGFVNHSSDVCMDSSAAYGVYGASFVGEAGDELGCFCDDVSVRNTAPFSAQSTSGMSGGLTNSNFARDGFGFWSQGGSLQFDGDIATGVAGGRLRVPRRHRCLHRKWRSYALSDQ